MLHNGLVHIISNVCVQLVVGVLLELSHGYVTFAVLSRVHMREW